MVYSKFKCFGGSYQCTKEAAKLASIHGNLETQEWPWGGYEL